MRLNGHFVRIKVGGIFPYADGIFLYEDWNHLKEEWEVLKADFMLYKEDRNALQGIFTQRERRENALCRGLKRPLFRATCEADRGGTPRIRGISPRQVSA